MYPAIIIPIVDKKSKTNMIILGTGIGKVFSFTEFVSLDVFGSVFFTLEVADSGVVSILIFQSIRECCKGMHFFRW